MFGWLFPPTCPCDSHAKAWVEERLQWLEHEFDDHAFNGRPIVLPTAEFFPDPYDGSDEAARTLVNRVCGYMGVEPRRINLEFVTSVGKMDLVNDGGHRLPEAAGTFQDRWGWYQITLDRVDLGNPMALVGTIAHELAHVRLLGERRISGTVFDNELLTDLTVVFMGMGIFLANTPRIWRSSYSKWPGTDFNKPEYMTPPMFGYALAHLAWFRGEIKPVWARHLHWNALPDFRNGVKFLFKTLDSGFRPRASRSSPRPCRLKLHSWNPDE